MSNLDYVVFTNVEEHVKSSRRAVRRRRVCPGCNKEKAENAFGITYTGKDTVCRYCRTGGWGAGYNDPLGRWTWEEYVAARNLSPEMCIVIQEAADAYVAYVKWHKAGGKGRYTAKTTADVLECYEHDWPLAAKLYAGAGILGREMLK